MMFDRRWIKPCFLMLVLLALSLFALGACDTISEETPAIVAENSAGNALVDVCTEFDLVADRVFKSLDGMSDDELDANRHHVRRYSEAAHIAKDECSEVDDRGAAAEAVEIEVDAMKSILNDIQGSDRWQQYLY